MGATPLSGLSGLNGYQYLVEENSQATPEDRMGGPADNAHGKFLAEPNIPRGSYAGVQHGPYGPENQLLADEGWFWEGGGYANEDPLFDRTPATHAGPWPKGIQSGPVGDVSPDAYARKLQQLNGLHGMGLNGDARVVRDRGIPLNDQWEELNELNPGETLLQPLSRQAMSAGLGWGTRDRTQSFARQNEFGFDSAHMHRRYATGSIPGNNYWMRPGGRVMAKSIAGPAKLPIGENSPFTGQDIGYSFNPDGAVLQNVPTEYVAPPQPNLQAAPSPASNDSYVEWY
jgi:hypothetical protein